MDLPLAYHNDVEEDHEAKSDNIDVTHRVACFCISDKVWEYDQIVCVQLYEDLIRELFFIVARKGVWFVPALVNQGKNIQVCDDLDLKPAHVWKANNDEHKATPSDHEDERE